MIEMLLLIGALFCLAAAWGVLRLPDLLSRMQATSKATTIGLGSLMLANAIYFGDIGQMIKALLFVGFVFVTAPIAAHMISRAARVHGVPLWEGTVIDELGSPNQRNKA